MFDLMAVRSNEELPLYLHSISRLLRELRIIHQKTGRPFHYGEFKKAIEDLSLTKDQSSPLKQRLDTLESFMPNCQSNINSRCPLKRGDGTNWTIKVISLDTFMSSDYKTDILKAGELTIFDLSGPCVTAEAASSIFDLCLSLFLEETSNVGKVVALDEAHKV